MTQLRLAIADPPRDYSLPYQRRATPAGWEGAAERWREEYYFRRRWYYCDAVGHRFDSEGIVNDCPNPDCMLSWHTQQWQDMMALDRVVPGEGGGDEVDDDHGVDDEIIAQRERADWEYERERMDWGRAPASLARPTAD